MAGRRQEKLVVDGQVHRLRDKLGNYLDGWGLRQRGDGFFIPVFLTLICQKLGKRLGNVRFQPKGGLFQNLQIDQVRFPRGKMIVECFLGLAENSLREKVVAITEVAKSAGLAQ